MNTELILFVSQIGMSIFGCPAFLLVIREEKKYQKLGAIFGLLSNPFWWGMMIVTEQWWTIPIHLLYTYGWINKIYELWFKK